MPKKPSPSHTPLSLVARVGLSGLALICAGLVAWSRIYLNYHTPKQVVVGYVAGSVSAITWFAATTIVRQIGLVSWALEQYPTRLFRMRDLVVEQDLCQAGWEKWEEKCEAKRISSQKPASGKKKI